MFLNYVPLLWEGLGEGPEANHPFLSEGSVSRGLNSCVLKQVLTNVDASSKTKKYTRRMPAPNPSQREGNDLPLPLETEI